MSIIFEYFFIFIKKTSIATEKKPIIAKKQVSNRKRDATRMLVVGNFMSIYLLK